MTMKLSRELSDRAFSIRTPSECEAWLADLDTAVGGLRWTAVGGIDNNVHAIEVAADPSSALVERVTNAIDAAIDLMALERG